MAGEIDLQASGLTFLDYSMLKENEEKGGYRVLDWEFVVDPCIFINHTFEDEQLRALFQNVKFRHGLSHALNRAEMNDLLWLGMAVPRNVAPVTADPFYKPEFGQVAIEYDVDKANALLDEAGLDKRDAEGYRLLPDGTRLELLLETFPTFEIGASAIDSFEQVASYWRAVGVMANAKEIESGLWWERASGNQMQMAAYGSTSFLWIVDPTCFVPTSGAYWATRYADWNDTKGESGEEPPAEYIQLYDWYQQVKAEPDAAKRLEPGYKIMQQCTDQVYIIGLCTPTLAPMIAKKDLVNVLEKGIHDWPVHRDMLTWPFQVWRRPA